MGRLLMLKILVVLQRSCLLFRLYASRLMLMCYGSIEEDRALLNAIGNLELTGLNAEALSKLGHKLEDVACQLNPSIIQQYSCCGRYNVLTRAFDEDIRCEIHSSLVDKAHLRLASAKAVLRLYVSVCMFFKVKAIDEEMGTGFLGIGFQPKWGLKDIPIMPKVGGRPMLKSLSCQCKGKLNCGRGRTVVTGHLLLLQGFR
ncbi:hypothetical protein K1719_029210 [Acacia pycnantha]|nr:hypothetical protein K1719_029210 [Acacia pycnantha]